MSRCNSSASGSNALRSSVLDPKSLDVLEYPKIIRRLAALCGSFVGRSLAQDLIPSADAEEVRRRLRLTAEALILRRIKPQLGLGSVSDARTLLDATARGVALTPSDLLTVMAFFRTRPAHPQSRRATGP